LAAPATGRIQITNMSKEVKLTASEVNVSQQINSLPNTTLQGAAREYVSESYFIRNGYTPLDGKCGSNCFDGVYVKNGNVYIVEVKPLNADGSIKLNGADKSTGLQTQMTDGWIADTVKTLKDSENPASVRTADAIIAAQKNGSLVKVVSGVNQESMVVVKLK